MITLKPDSARQKMLKLALIPALAGVLAWVLWSRQSPTGQGGAPGEQVSLNTSGVSPTLAVQGAQTGEARLQDLLAHNPFQPLDEAAAAPPATSAEEGSVETVPASKGLISTLAERAAAAAGAATGSKTPSVRVQAVLHSGRGSTVLTDRGALQTGDRIDDDTHVVHIGEEGIVISGKPRSK